MDWDSAVSMNFRIGRDSEEEQLELGRISNQEGFRRGAQGRSFRIRSDSEEEQSELGRIFELRSIFELGRILKRSSGS